MEIGLSLKKILHKEIYGIHQNVIDVVTRLNKTVEIAYVSGKIHWSRDKIIPILETLCSNYFLFMKITSSIEISVKFTPRVWLLTISNYWLRWWLGAEQATSHYLNQWWSSILMHMCFELVMVCCTDACLYVPWPLCIYILTVSHM